MTLPPASPGAPAHGADGADPSMEEILASIRRILNEDEPVGGAAEEAQEESESDDDVLVLDRSMLIAAPEVDAAAPDAEQPAPAAEAREPAAIANPKAAETPEAEDAKAADLANRPAETQVAPINETVSESSVPAMSAPDPLITAAPMVESQLPPSQALVGPETAAATAMSVEGLMRALAASRTAQVYRGGPTIEDLVREELRVLLKGWLEDNLPQLVERLVRAEIEKLVGRAAP